VSGEAPRRPPVPEPKPSPPEPSPAVAPRHAPPHAPQRGRLARLLGPFHVTGIFWYRFHSLGARFSEPAKRFLLPIFVALFFVTLLSIRRAIGSNLRVALGPTRWLGRQRRIWRTLHSYAWSLTERYERLTTDQPFAVEMEGRELWDGLATEEGRGVLVVTGHVGNWEMASALPAQQEGKRVHVVREEELDPKAQEYIARRLRARMGSGYTTHFAAGDPLLGLALREALDRGEMVALQGDRPRRGGGSVETSLFGRPYRLPVGPLALARQAGVPLLPVFVHRLGRRRYRIVFHPPVPVERTADRHADLATAAARFTTELEAAIARTPHQWFVFGELWPEGGGFSGKREGAVLLG
jgi:phosphatidylinositol dimannoside acyltransferase